MKRYIILLPLLSAIVLIPLRYTSAGTVNTSADQESQTSLPVASSVLGLSGTISAAGAVGYLILSRNKDR